MNPIWGDCTSEMGDLKAVCVHGRKQALLTARDLLSTAGEWNIDSALFH